MSSRAREYRAEIDVPENASELRLGLAFEGTGAAYLDDVRVEGAKLNTFGTERTMGR